MQMHVDLCWFIIPWSSLMWPKDYLNVCAIHFYYNFSVNFFQSTWIRPQKIFQTKILEVTSLVNHHPVLTLSFQKTMSCWTVSAKCSLTMVCKRKVVKVYLWNAIVTKHLHVALTIWHSNIDWNEMFTGWWLTSDVTSRILVWKIFCGCIQVLWRKLSEKL